METNSTESYPSKSDSLTNTCLLIDKISDMTDEEISKWAEKRYIEISSKHTEKKSFSHVFNPVLKGFIGKNDEISANELYSPFLLDDEEIFIFNGLCKFFIWK